MAKKPVVKTAEVKAAKAVEVKPAEVKATKEVEVKPAEVKVEKAVEVKKEEPVKAAAKPVAKKPAAKKPAAKKATKEKVVSQPEVFVQYDDNGTQQASVADIVAKVKALYVAEGHRESSIKSLQVYMKPQEWKAYYVINGKVTGDVDLF